MFQLSCLGRRERCHCRVLSIFHIGSLGWRGQELPSTLFVNQFSCLCIAQDASCLSTGFALAAISASHLTLGSSANGFAQLPVAIISTSGRKGWKTLFIVLGL